MSPLCHPAVSSRGPIYFAYPKLVETLAQAVFDSDAYESAAEPTFDRATVVRIADTLGAAGLPEMDFDPFRNMSVSPYWGEVHITWGNPDHGRRIKVIFAQSGKTFSIYHEEDVQGSPLHYDIIRNASRADLGTWVRWVHS